MDLEVLGLALGLLVASILFGDMLRRIGVQKGWHANGTFWIGFIVYNLAGYGLIFLELIEITLFIIAVCIFFPFVGHQSKGLPRRGRSGSGRLATPHATFGPTEKRVEAASEVVTVPPGVTIRVKRSRTVQHTITVSWNVSGEISGNAGLMEIVNVAIKTAVEHSKETAYQEAETIEYEVELNGNVSKGYKLVWTDVWKQGQVEAERNGRALKIPFEYRERSELNVIPVSE